ncbi:MAG: electron transfer flavoprotein subunit beta/FixA family protein [Synergistaceae bacterium]|jgi:electron transfer flavoprotein beta subunit|nr:electron transfer flavoprotein subunit beta/FixA family protein [Synergistaceae bacterium]
MKVAVLIKQVPATENVKIDPKTGVMVREGLAVEVNPLDLHAIEEAVRIKERTPGVSVTALTMGPPAAAKAARYAVSMGCDAGVVITDRAFAGSDTLATARVLAEAVKKLGPFDLILAGERATDGETGQVGPLVAALLGVPPLTYVSGLEFGSAKVEARRAVEGGHERVSAPLPALAVVVKEINSPRLCTLSGKLRGKSAEIGVMSLADVGLPAEKTGLTGSPTRVVNVSYPKVTRECRKVSADGGGAVEAMLGFIEEVGV